MSEETDAVLLVVSEETGRISVAVAGKLEPVPRENLAARLASLAESAARARRAVPRTARPPGRRGRQRETLVEEGSPRGGVPGRGAGEADAPA